MKGNLEKRRKEGNFQRETIILARQERHRRKGSKGAREPRAQPIIILGTRRKRKLSKPGEGRRDLLRNHNQRLEGGRNSERGEGVKEGIEGGIDIRNRWDAEEKIDCRVARELGRSNQ